MLESAYPLPSYSVFTADTLRYEAYAVTLNFDPVTVTFDLWSWTCMVDRLRATVKLYQIWAQSSNPRRSYCDLNMTLWPGCMCHVRVVLWSEVVCTNTLWSWALTRWPWKFVVDLVSRGHKCSKFDRNRTICGRVIDDFAHFRRPFLGGGTFSGRFSWVRGPNFTKLGEDTGPSWAELRVCFRVEMSCCIFKRWCLKVERRWKWRQISPFLTPCKN